MSKHYNAWRASNKYYIAYGSNMSVEQMKIRCPDAVPVGTAVLRGWRLVFRLHATIEPEAGCEVPVVIWAVSGRDERNLDHYEGFPNYYHKKTLPVNVKFFEHGKRETVDAMVYIMNDGRPAEMPLISYFDVIEEGYQRFGFNKDILREALRYTNYVESLHTALK